MDTVRDKMNTGWGKMQLVIFTNRSWELSFGYVYLYQCFYDEVVLLSDLRVRHMT